MSEDAVEVHIVGAHHQVGERVQTKIGVRGRSRCGVEVDLQLHDFHRDVASLVGSGEIRERGDGGLIRLRGSGPHLGVPRIQDGAVSGDRGQSDTPYRARVAHPSTLSRPQRGDCTHDG